MHIESHGTASEARSLVAGTTDHIIHAFQDLDLEVWAKKSTAIVGRTSLVASLVRVMASRKVTATKQAKMLGAPAGGDRRRAVRALHVWVTAFHTKIPRIHALRKMGVRTELLTRAAGTPMVMYSVETVGMADTHLQRTESVIARTAAPSGRGKNPDMILYALNAGGGCFDPAFDAHVLPIQAWAFA